jgi:hypothetical protein
MTGRLKAVVVAYIFIGSALFAMRNTVAMTTRMMKVPICGSASEITV